MLLRNIVFKCYTRCSSESEIKLSDESCQGTESHQTLSITEIKIKALHP